MSVHPIAQYRCTNTMDLGPNRRVPELATWGMKGGCSSATVIGAPRVTPQKTKQNNNHQNKQTTHTTKSKHASANAQLNHTPHTVSPQPLSATLRAAGRPHPPSV